MIPHASVLVTPYTVALQPCDVSTYSPPYDCMIDNT